MPACVRETVGWLSARSLPINRPMVSPSLSITTGSKVTSLRMTIYLLIVVGDWWLAVGPPKYSSSQEVDHLNDMNYNQRQHQRSHNDVRGQPHFQRMMQIDQRVNPPHGYGLLNGAEEISLLVGGEALGHGLQFPVDHGDYLFQRFTPE